VTVVGLPERKPRRQYILQVVSGQKIPVGKEALVELTLGKQTLKFLVFVADITDEIILGWKSCGPTTRHWTWDAMCYDWARKRCQ
jgi:hypothetical protein